jgi:hypothetical protein
MLLCFSVLHFVWPMPLATPAFAGRREDLRMDQTRIASRCREITPPTILELSLRFVAPLREAGVVNQRDENLLYCAAKPGARASSEKPPNDVPLPARRTHCRSLHAAATVDSSDAVTIMLPAVE